MVVWLRIWVWVAMLVVCVIRLVGLIVLVAVVSFVLGCLASLW